MEKDNKLIVGDPHAKPDNKDKLQQLFNLVESKELNTVWMGDLLDTKDIVRAQCLNAYINYFKNSKLHHIILTGNHDFTNSDCKEHSLEALKLLKNVTVVDKPHVEGETLYLPYYRNSDEFRAAISQYKHCKYLFMHQDTIGMDYGNGYISTEGNTIEDLKQFQLVISGHYHSYQDKGNLIYIGTPFSHSFGESNQDKYLGVFNERSGKFCTIKTNFPRHITVHMDASKPTHVEANKDDHVRIILKGTKEELDSFNRKPYAQFKIVEECVTTLHKSPLKETETPEVTYSKWYKEVKKGSDEDLFKLGLDVLKAVK